MAKAVDLSKYNFGEKDFETINGVDCPVWQTPKYIEAKKKVIETLQSDKYKDILDTSDFWILINTYAGGKKVMYSGLIISHNGCLKINDVLPNKVNPKCFTVDKEAFRDSLIYIYCDDEVYEVGEVSKENCKNNYPYAMAYKRCFDRVVLKKSKLAYSGIYSDSEAEEFGENKSDQPKEPSKPKKQNSIITETQQIKLKESIENNKIEDSVVKNILKEYNYNGINEIETSKYPDIINKFKEEINKKKGNDANVNE